MGKVDKAEIARLADLCGAIIEGATGQRVSRHSSSTDCNVPLSLGIPAICVGVYRGGGAHTREEWIEKASLPIGLEVGIKMIDAVVKA
jgi:di/tripeptidase